MIFTNAECSPRIRFDSFRFVSLVACREISTVVSRILQSILYTKETIWWSSFDDYDNKGSKDFLFVDE